MGPDDGLSQGSNYFRYEDSRGFMWLTANDAINRYDGSLVKVYNLDTYFINCPNLQQGYGFAEDEAGNIYIGSGTGIYIYHRDKDRFTRQQIFTGAMDAAAIPIAVRQGKLWCFNKRYQLATYDLHTGRVEYHTGIAINPIGALHIYSNSGSEFFYRLPFFDKEGFLWLVSANEVVRYNPLTRQCSYPLQSWLHRQPRKLNSCSYDTATHTVFWGTNKGFARYDIKRKTLTHITEIDKRPLGITNAVCVGPHFYAVRSDAGVFFARKDFTQVKWATHSTEKYHATYQYGFDKSGRLWLCDDGLGQLVFNFSPALFNKEPSESSLLNGPDRYSIGTFAALPNGNVFIQQETPKSNPVKHGKPLLVPGTGRGQFRFVTDTVRKGFWCYPLAYYNKKAPVYFFNWQQQLRMVCSISEEDSMGPQQDMQPLPGGRLLCSFDKGLYWLDAQKGIHQKIAGQPWGSCFKINLLGNNRVAISYLDGDMWLADLGHGNTLTFLHTLLPGVQSFYMAEDTVRQRYWVGTNQGMFLLDSHFSILKKFDANTGLAGTNIYGLLLDDEGNAWCSHQRGLSSINAASYAIINYTPADGLQGWDFNNRAFYKHTNGTLYFGGVNGFNYFKPPLQPYNFYTPEIYINQVVVNNRLLLPDTNINLVQQWQLPYGDYNIAVHAVVKDLGGARSIQLAYRLNGSAWAHQPRNTFINFSNLAPGSYVLELAVYNELTGGLQLQKTVHIIIATPFYYTNLFRVLLSVLATALVLWGVYRWRIWRQQQKQRQQQALEQQRRKITADLHDDIGASLSSLQINSTLAGRLVMQDAARAQVLLDKIGGQAQSLSENIGDFIWSMKPGSESLMTLGGRIKNFAAALLGAGDTAYTIDVADNADSLVTDFSMRKNLVLIVKEALNNAAKYSRARHITVSLAVQNGRVQLLVQDDGVGIAAGSLQGNGLQNMRKRTAELGGTFAIDTGPGRGTAITLSIPIPEINDNHL